MHTIDFGARAAQQFLKWGVQVLKFFLTLPLLAPGGDIKQDITVFITAIMTYKQGCRGYEISHPYPYTYPQILRGYPWIYPYP